MLKLGPHNCSRREPVRPASTPQPWGSSFWPALLALCLSPRSAPDTSGAMRSCRADSRRRCGGVTPPFPLHSESRMVTNMAPDQGHPVRTNHDDAAYRLRKPHAPAHAQADPAGAGRRGCANGLPGDHHFFITFDTMHPDVEIADWLSDRYPDAMTVVMQHWFDNLACLR